MSSDLQTTFIIKAFERPEKPVALVKSIQKFYPNVPIIIIDDSKKPSEEKWAPHIQYFHTEYDIGASEGRNRAVKLVKTKYFVLLDDDFEFTEQTKIETFKELLEKYNFDLIGGDFVNYGWQISKFVGFFKIYRKVLYACIYRYPTDGYNAIPVDFTHNFFLAKTDVIQKNLWDSELKIGEHESFFLNLKNNHVKVGYTPHVSVNHWPDYGEPLDDKIINQAYYDARLTRSASYLRIFYQKNGLKKHVELDFCRFPFFPSLLFGRKHADSYYRYFSFFNQCNRGNILLKDIYWGFNRRIILLGRFCNKHIFYPTKILKFVFPRKPKTKNQKAKS